MKAADRPKLYGIMPKKNSGPFLSWKKGAFEAMVLKYPHKMQWSWSMGGVGNSGFVHNEDLAEIIAEIRASVEYERAILEKRCEMLDALRKRA